LFIRRAGRILKKIRGVRVTARFLPKLDGKRVGASSCGSARRRVRAQFKINTEANSITPLTARTFGELGFKERGNLQEWIAKEPSCLGEELLVIPEGSLVGFPTLTNRSTCLPSTSTSASIRGVMI